MTDLPRGTSPGVTSTWPRGTTPGATRPRPPSRPERGPGGGKVVAGGGGKVMAVGIDLAQVADARQAVADFGQGYLRRMFTAGELSYCLSPADPAPRLASVFAAKEATIKALAVGAPKPPWTSIEVRRRPEGSWEVRLEGLAAELAQKQGINNLAASLSCKGDVATAIVVAMGAH